MNKRQKEIQEIYLNNEEACLDALTETYEGALADINARIAELLGRDDADLQHVIYQVEYQQAMRSQVEAILDQLQTQNFESISQYLAQCYEDGFLGTMYDLQGQGIPLVFPIDQEQVVDAILHETNLSESLYESLDLTKLKRNISSEISRGISQGLMYGDISDNISRYAGISKNNAMRIARTEGHRIQCTASMNACERAKEKGADVVKQWDASLDGRTRDSHRQVDGEVRELEEKFSNGLMFPSDPSGRAEEVINCRCGLLQRARWALDEPFAKWSENAPVLYDDDGTTQFIHFDDANDYEQFKTQYMERVRSTAQMTSDSVNELFEFTYGNERYKVDGKHVLLDANRNEINVANLLSESLGEQVNILPRVVFPQGVQTADYLIGNERYDLKTPTGSGKNVLYNMVKGKENQASNFVFDVSNCPLTIDEIYERVEGLYSSTHTSFVDEVIIINDGRIIKKFKRNK